MTLSGILLGPALLAIGFVASMSLAIVFLIQLPATYFLDSNRQAWSAHRPTLAYWVVIVLKNLLGMVLVGIGIVMLFTPGQGILTIFIGVTLLSFPGKRRLERALIARPHVLEPINRLRAFFSKPPFVMERWSDQAAATHDSNTDKSEAYRYPTEES
jgi:hypothetical protein